MAGQDVPVALNAFQAGKTVLVRGAVDLATFNAFADQNVRLKFIRRVYGILCAQLAVTLSFVACVHSSKKLANFMTDHLALVVGALMMSIVSLVPLLCLGCSRCCPMNLIFLSIFTLCEAYVLGSISAYRDDDVVIQAVITTSIIVVALTLFAAQTRIDFTLYWAFMLISLIIFITIGLFALFLDTPIEKIIYSSVGAFIFSSYLIIDTQMIVGGHHKNQFSPEDYILASVSLYIDVVNIFFYVSNIINLRSS